MKGISVYLLDDKSRSALAEKFKPLFTKFVGHHVTYKFGASDEEPLPPPGEYWVVGHAYEKERRIDGSGIEALIVSINDSIVRPDGGTFHITWSHGPTYSAKDSNRIIKNGWQKFPTPIKINLEPKFLPFN